MDPIRHIKYNVPIRPLSLQAIIKTFIGQLQTEDNTFNPFLKNKTWFQGR